MVGGAVRADPYRGVTPGSGGEPPRSQAARKSSGRLLTWPGFQMLPGGGSRVFVQTSRKPHYETKRKKDRVELLLEGTRIHLRNNRRPLETRFFDTPVLQVKVERRGRDLAVVVHLREEATAKVHDEPAPEGDFHFVYVDFPARSGARTPEGGGADDEGEGTQDGQARDSETPPGM